MNLRFRLLLILFGALAVAAAYTFPLWQPLVMNQDDISPFPELAEDLQLAFEFLPPVEQSAYLQLRAENPSMALQMVTARLQPDVVIPQDAQGLPVNEGQVAVATGDFLPISPIRSAQGTATIYQLPDGTRFLWLSDFSALQGPGVRVLLSTLTLEDIEDAEEAEAEDNTPFAIPPDDVLLDPLAANVGNQRYDVPREIDLSLYRSIVLYSPDVNRVYSIAPLRQQ